MSELYFVTPQKLSLIIKNFRLLGSHRLVYPGLLQCSYSFPTLNIYSENDQSLFILFLL